MKNKMLAELLRRNYPTPDRTRRSEAAAAAAAYRPQPKVRPMYPLRELIMVSRYISCPFWAGQLLLLLMMILIGRERAAVMLGAPIVAMIGFGELVRAFAYGMWELEQTCRCHLRRLLFGRFVVTGLFDLAVLLTANALIGGKIPALRGAVYSVTLFTLTSFICFWLFALTPQLSVRLAVTGGACGLCLAMVQLRDMAGGRLDLLSPACFGGWLVALAVSTVLLGAAVKRYILKEDTKWISVQRG
ncbi:MAG: hypothetical protein IKL84_03285 [Clostridia bacterium]|nr:hypothetical protein [Clostridia bacterium]